MSEVADFKKNLALLRKRNMSHNLSSSRSREKKNEYTPVVVEDLVVEKGQISSYVDDSFESLQSNESFSDGNVVKVLFEPSVCLENNENLPQDDSMYYNANELSFEECLPKKSAEVKPSSHRISGSSTITPSRVLVPSEKRNDRTMSPTQSKNDSEFGKQLHQLHVDETALSLSDGLNKRVEIVSHVLGDKQRRSMKDRMPATHVCDYSGCEVVEDDRSEFTVLRTPSRVNDSDNPDSTDTWPSLLAPYSGKKVDRGNDSGVHMKVGTTPASLNEPSCGDIIDDAQQISKNEFVLSMLGDEWKEAKVEGSGKSYYYNRRTRVSSWKLPKNAVYIRTQSKAAETGRESSNTPMYRIFVPHEDSLLPRTPFANDSGMNKSVEANNLSFGSRTEVVSEARERFPTEGLCETIPQRVTATAPLYETPSRGKRTRDNSILSGRRGSPFKSPASAAKLQSVEQAVHSAIKSTRQVLFGNMDGTSFLNASMPSSIMDNDIGARGTHSPSSWSVLEEENDAEVSHPVRETRLMPADTIHTAHESKPEVLDSLYENDFEESFVASQVVDQTVDAPAVQHIATESSKKQASKSPSSIAVNDHTTRRKLFNEDTPAIAKCIMFCPLCASSVATADLSYHVEAQCEASSAFLYGEGCTRIEEFLSAFELGCKRVGLISYQYRGIGDGVGGTSTVAAGDRSVGSCELELCPDCGRSFAKGRLEIHGRVCAKVFKSKEKPVDFRRRRTNGTGAEYYDCNVSRVEKLQAVPPSSSKKATVVESTPDVMNTHDTPATASRTATPLSASARRKLESRRSNVNTAPLFPFPENDGVVCGETPMLYGSSRKADLSCPVCDGNDFQDKEELIVHMRSCLSATDTVTADMLRTGEVEQTAKNELLSGTVKLDGMQCACPYCAKPLRDNSMLSAHFLSCKQKKLRSQTMFAEKTGVVSGNKKSGKEIPAAGKENMITGKEIVNTSEKPKLKSTPVTVVKVWR